MERYEKFLAAKTATGGYQEGGDQSELPVILHQHNESIFNANDDERTFWGEKDDKCLKKKSLGSGIMMSGFINAQIRQLKLTQQQWTDLKQIHPQIPQSAWFSMEYGKNKEGYFESEKFLTQAKWVVIMANYLWPNHRHLWCFDHSGVHKKKAANTLVAD